MGCAKRPALRRSNNICRALAAFHCTFHKSLDGCGMFTRKEEATCRFVEFLCKGKHARVRLLDKFATTFRYQSIRKIAQTMHAPINAFTRLENSQFPACAV